MRIDGRDAFINRLGRWDDPVAVAKAYAIAAQIWSDYQQGCFDRSLMAYQPLVNGKQVGLLEALKVRAESKRQAAAIHAHKLLEHYGKPIRTRSDCREVGATGGNQMKTITIRLPDVEAAMLVEVQKRNKAYKDLQQLLIQQIRQEYQKTSGGLGR